MSQQFESDVAAIGGKIGTAVKYGHPEQAAEWRAELAVARINRAVQKELAAAPPLNDRQREALRSIVSEAVA